MHTVPPLPEVLSPLPHASQDVWFDSLAMVFSAQASHSTVAYVKSLEAQKKQAQDKLREEVQRHKALRIAHRAQSRSLEKLMGKIKGKTRV